MDKTNLSTVPKYTHRLIAPKGKRQAGSPSRAEKSRRSSQQLINYQFNHQKRILNQNCLRKRSHNRFSHKQRVQSLSLQPPKARSPPLRPPIAQSPPLQHPTGQSPPL
ncbi:hypothetical protein PoB_006537000 [Plakobranchus ocellatus]|uniref:Uncharacterized protein n=1 Tax=Plakobranchus ocellatus TaxID=259542 RepID=A0AAV4D4F4_9GAST|nr:hypothetical protein PoB_006537000 [Plakobranchus ocellatus]